MSADNTIRANAEATYQSALASDLNGITMSLLQVCAGHPDARVKGFSTILLQQNLKPLVSRLWLYC